jgi:hypothetical protein
MHGSRDFLVVKSLMDRRSQLLHDLHTLFNQQRYCCCPMDALCVDDVACQQFSLIGAQRRR